MIEILFIFIVVGFAVITYPSSSNRYPTNYSNSTDNTDEISSMNSGKYNGNLVYPIIESEITKIGDEYHLTWTICGIEDIIILTEEEYLKYKDKIKHKYNEIKK